MSEWIPQWQTTVDQVLSSVSEKVIKENEEFKGFDFGVSDCDDFRGFDCVSSGDYHLGGCKYCHIESFSRSEFYEHHMLHVSDPIIKLRRVLSTAQDTAPAACTIKKEECFMVKESNSCRLVLVRKNSKKENKRPGIYNKRIKGKRLNHRMSEVAQDVAGSSTSVPSPTPSEILRPAGLMPRSPFGGSVKGEDDGEEGSVHKSESPTSEMDHDSEDENDDITSEMTKLENGVENVAKQPPLNVKTDAANGEDTDSEMSALSGEYNDVEQKVSTSALPKVGSLTVLAPSSLNSSVLNGTLSISSIGNSTKLKAEPESINIVGGLSIEPISLNGSSSSQRNSGVLSGLDPSENTAEADPLDLLQGFIDQSAGDNMEYIPLDRLGAGGGSTRCEVCGEHASDPVAMEAHKASLGHFKCCASTECAVVLFGSKAELTNHQLIAHGIQPPPVAPNSASALAPLEKLALQPLPGCAASPAAPAQSMSPRPGQTAQQGTHRIQPRAFANMSQARMPVGSSPRNSTEERSLGGSPTHQRLLPVKRSASSPVQNGKQPRLDVLLPDSHDDADCHVIALQKANDSGLQIQSIQGGGREAVGSSFQLSSAISLTPSNARPAPSQPPKKGNDANVVANLLATRGITVTPAGGGNRQMPQPPVQQPQMAPMRNPVAQPVATLNLNSAVSIIPTNQGRQNVQPGFAVPQGRIRNQPPPVDRNVRLPTVDLTQDTPPPPQVHRGRPPGRANRHTCQVCDKVFPTPDALSTHMATHRSPGGKLPYRCNLCNAQYPTQQGLAQHKLTFHKEHGGSEMALIVVDLKQPGITNRLSSLGIRHCIPLSQLQSQSGGVFGLPIIAIDNARNPAVCNLGAVGASNILSVGPLKNIGPR